MYFRLISRTVDRNNLTLRRILRVHLGKDVAAGLAKLREIIQKSL